MEAMEEKSLSVSAWNGSDISASSSLVTIVTELPSLHYKVTDKGIRCLPKFHETEKIKYVINFDRMDVIG